MANQCVFKRINPTGYAYLMQFMEEQDICSKCPCCNNQCNKATSVTDCDKQPNEELFTNFLMQVTRLSPVDLEEALGDFEHLRRVKAHQRYIQRLSSKTRVLTQKKGTPD